MGILLHDVFAVYVEDELKPKEMAGLWPPAASIQRFEIFLSVNCIDMLDYLLWNTYHDIQVPVLYAENNWVRI